MSRKLPDYIVGTGRAQSPSVLPLFLFCVILNHSVPIFFWLFKLLTTSHQSVLNNKKTIVKRLPLWQLRNQQIIFCESDLELLIFFCSATL